jgi:hypothetical protein
MGSEGDPVSRDDTMTAAAEAARILARDGAAVMLIGDEADPADRAAEAVTLARETAAQRNEVGALTGAVAEWADWELAGGRPPMWVAQRMITANRLIAAAARGEAATI